MSRPRIAPAEGGVPVLDPAQRLGDQFRVFEVRWFNRAAVARISASRGDEAIASASTLKAFAASSRRIDPGLVFNFRIMANIVISPNSPHPFVQPGCGRVDPAQSRAARN